MCGLIYLICGKKFIMLTALNYLKIEKSLNTDWLDKSTKMNRITRSKLFDAYCI